MGQIRPASWLNVVCGLIKGKCYQKANKVLMYLQFQRGHSGLSVLHGPDRGSSSPPSQSGVTGQPRGQPRIGQPATLLTQERGTEYWLHQVGVFLKGELMTLGGVLWLVHLHGANVKAETRVVILAINVIKLDTHKQTFSCLLILNWKWLITVLEKVLCRT